MKELAKKREKGFNPFNPQKGFAQMYKDANLEEPIGVEVHALNLIELKEMAKEVARGDPESTKEKGEEDHYLFFVGHWVVVPMARSPLEAFLFPDEPVRGQLLDVPFSD